jgi:hypothetical protein
MPIVPLLLSAALATSAPDNFQAQLDARLAAMNASIAAAQRESQATLAPELAQLSLPVRDHLSAVQYCAFMIRHLNTPDPAPILAARTQAGWLDAVKGAPLAEGLDESIEWGSLGMRLEHPYFSKTNTDLGGPRVYIATQDGACTILTTNDPGASERTLAWLGSAKSGWKEFPHGREQRWRFFKVRNPNTWSAGIAIFHAVVPPAAQKAGVSSADVIAMTGLP